MGPSYWRAFLRHPYNRLGVLGMTAVAVFLSFPLGWPGMALGLLGLAAVEVVGLTVVPGLPSFRAVVNRAQAGADRTALRDRLLREINLRGGSSHLADYEQMQQRVASLYRMAADVATSFGEREVDQLDDVTVRYLRLCLSDAVMNEQNGGDTSGTVERKLREVVQRLARPLEDPEKQSLLRAKNEYEEVLKRQGRMVSRRSALDASLVSMPVRMEEVYQMVMTAPSADNLGAMLEESMQKLRISEQVTMELEEPLVGLSIPDSPVATATTAGARVQSAARRAIGSREQ